MQRVGIAIAYAVVVGVLFGAAFVLQPLDSRAEDAPGCEGLEDYSEQMLDAGAKLVEFWEEADIGPEREPTTYSSNDGTHYAEGGLQFQRALREIDPPAWAETWHVSKIEIAGLQEQIGKAAAEGGVLVILAFEEAIDANEAREDAAYAEATEACEDFAEFEAEWDALDGQVEGTPIATPVDTQS
jgi:hypothetical protein